MNQALSITLHRIIGLLVITLFQNIQERTKALVFVFVHVLVDEQAISSTSYVFGREGLIGCLLDVVFG